MASPTKPLADRIREFTLRTFIRPALKSGKSEVTIRAGDIHATMPLRDRMPAVCSALESKKFQEMCGLELTQRRGPHRGANVYLTFGGHRSTQRQSAPHSVKPQSLPHAQEKPKRKRATATDPDALYLVACVKTKRKTRAPAKDLYISSL